MLTELDTLIQEAFVHPQDAQIIARVYEAFFKASLFIPCQKLSSKEQADLMEQGEEFIPLYLEHEASGYLVAFDTLDRLKAWSGDHYLSMDHKVLSGGDFVAGAGEKVFICLNVGTPYYKEFNPQEVAKLKAMLRANKKHSA